FDRTDWLHPPPFILRKGLPQNFVGRGKVVLTRLMDTLTSFSRNMGLKRSIPFAVRRWLPFKAVLTESSAPYRATDGKRFWDFDAGTGIMAPPVTYLQDVVQYITLMVGWGGAAALANIPGGGPIKRGYSSVLTFSVRRLLDGMDGKGRKTPDVHF